MLFLLIYWIYDNPIDILNLTNHKTFLLRFLEATTEEGEASQEKTSEPKTSQKKSKKNKNQLSSDELEIIPLTHTGTSINRQMKNIRKFIIFEKLQ